MLSNSSQVERNDQQMPAGSAVELAGLGNHFIGLFGRKWSRRAFAAEMAKLLAQATGAKATAVLGCNRRGESLVLLAEHGLPNDARIALSSGADSAWDIPLRGLQNRRISVIEAAHQNPFVPRTLTNFSPSGLCIVSLPVYYDYEPVGVVLLFAARSRAFPDAQLQTLSQALRVCGRGLRERESARPAGVGDAVAAAAADAAAERTATVAEISPTSPPALRVLSREDIQPAGLRLPPVPISETQRVEHDLARAQAEMQRRSEAVRNAATAARALKVERDGLLQQLTELEYLRTSEATELRGQVASLEERLLAAESERLRYQRAADAKQQRAEQSIRELQAERDGLLERLRTLESSGTEVQGLLGDLGQERDQLAAQADALTRELQSTRHELEQARAGDVQSRSAFEAERAAAATDLARLQAVLEDVRQQHASSEAARDRQLAARDEELAALRAQFERAGVEHHERAQALESALAAARAQIERLTQDGASLQAQLGARDVELARLREENERARQAEGTVHDTATALREEIAKLIADAAQSAAAAGAREGELGSALAQAQAEIETLRRASADRDALARTAGDLGDKTAELEGLAESLRAQVVTAQAESASAQERAAELRAQLEAARREHEQARATAEHERAQLEAAVQRADAAAAAAAAQTDELRQTVHDAVERLEQERLRHASEIEGLLEEPAVQTVAPEMPAGTPEDVASQAIAREETEERPFIIERSAPLATVDTGPEPAELPQPAVAPLRLASAMGELVVLDEGPAAKEALAALYSAGFEVTQFALGEATVDELARRKLKCIMLNLASGPVAWRTLKLLRERAGTRNVPVLAYVMTPEAPTGFCFGRTDFALWPLEPGRMIERLGRLRPKLHRLLAVTSDVDGMGRLREPLARAKISTSIVLDARQVLDFAAMVDPEAAILHVSPTCPSAARAIISLRANEATRELPLMVLLDRSSGSDEAAFFSQASRQLLSKAGFQFSRLPEEIGRLIG